MEKEYYDQLRTRAFVTATLFLEADEISAERLERYRQRYVRQLPTEITRVFSMDNEEVFTGEETALASEYFDRIKEERQLNYRNGDRQYHGIFYEDNQGDFIIVASGVDESGMKVIENLRLVLFIVFFAGVLITFMAGKLFARQALLPIREVVREAKLIGADQLSRRINAGSGKDEISELSEAFNKMLERLQKSFAMQGEFISNASHELKTPLTAISTELQAALMGNHSAGDAKLVLESVQEEVNKLSELTEGLLNLARINQSPENIQMFEFRIDEIFDNVKDRLMKVFPRRRVKVLFEGLSDPDALLVRGNPQLIEIALKNVFENALKFSGEDSTVEVAFSSDGGKLTIDFKDEGQGILEEDKERVFDLFYRAESKLKKSGYGLGLALTRQILTFHGATITCLSSSVSGTTMRVVF